MHYDLIARTDHVAEVERLMRIDEAVLRYLSIKINDKIDVDARKDELAKRAELIKKMTSKENNLIS